ncbi:MAG TPA: flagellar basal body rod protein FlgB, partial [Syntrophomonadaceae bacterium]|nr:flagellar basal body rod protein FlgB [Syntrophomonadaceae bacterium]
MLEKMFNSPNLLLMEKAMDASLLRQNVIANNIANVDTPKFKRSEVIFEDRLREALLSDSSSKKLLKTNSRHMDVCEQTVEALTPAVVKINDRSYRNDQNNVDIDVEMAKHTRNKIYYDYMAHNLSNDLRLLRMAITGRD